ncbi:unnamed protein product [Polarella glacialis]|uniref:H(+)-exporting diphosphatase n=1 Tax=Polarella glacialis TaxID=89957 RepID=A0A813HNV9_POLGL|nr:unnamed protein product [Polarella glacialis]CAE8738665.1 unnamed protein product [Polarella glacialis]
MATSLFSSNVASLALALLLCGLSTQRVAGQAADPIPDELGEPGFDMNKAKETLVCDPAEKGGFACAVCFVDVGQAYFSLGLAAVSIRDSVHLCNKDWDPTGDISQLKWTEDNRAQCTVAVANVVSFLGFVVAYVSAAASDCARTLNLNGYCSADVANLAADLATIVSGGADAKLSCRSKYAWNRPKPTLEELLNTTIRDKKIDRAAHKHHRRLVEVARLPPSEAMFPHWADRSLDVAEDYQKVKEWQQDVRSRRYELAACSFNIGNGVLYIMRALLSIVAASRSCPAPVIAKEGEPGKMVCAVDVSGLIGSFSWAASSIAFAVTQCPIGQSLQAACAGDLTAAVASIAGIVTSGSSFAITCGKLASMGAGGRLLRGVNETSVSEGIQRTLEEEMDSMAKSMAKLVMKPEAF